LTPAAAQLLSRMIEAKLAFLISGGTGSGNPTRRLPHTISRPRQET
jgi:Flp pilus assembly CpaF family ATPase